MPQDLDVFIIGGGPAGAVAAARLAGRGLRVAVAEGRAFPRVKVCGEFLTPAVSRLLETHLGSDALRGAGAERVERIELFASGRFVTGWSMPTDAAAWSLSRAMLDALLLDRARAAGAVVMQPAPVRGVEYHNDAVTVTTDDGAMRARCVVHADGHGRFDPAGPVLTRARARLVGLKCHLRANAAIGCVPGVLQLHGFTGPPGAGRSQRGYFGLVRVEGGLATLAMVAPTAMVKQFEGDHDALLRAVWPRAEAATRVGEWLTCPVPSRGYVTPGHPRSFRIGNAAAAVEPVAGEGIGLAVWSGDLLGGVLDIDALPATQRAITSAYRRRLRLRRPAAAAIAAFLSRPGLINVVRPALARRPGVAMWPLYRLSGKPA